MRRYLQIYKECLRIAFNQAAAYRLNFMLTACITLFSNILFPLVTIMIYRTGSSFPGWNIYEVMLLQSIFSIADGMAGIFTGGVLWATMNHVREGSLDTVLLKPVNTLMFLASSTLEPANIGIVAGGGILYGISVSHVKGITFGNVVGSIILFLAGVAVLMGMAFFMAAVSFKWVGNSRMPEIFDSIKSFGKYPITIFPGVIRSLVTFCIPVGVVGYYPASVLLGKGTAVMKLLFTTCIPCGLFLLLSIWVFGYMVHLYEGVGG